MEKMDFDTEVNWYVVGLVIFIALAIIVLTVRKNRKEKQKLKKFLDHENQSGFKKK